MFKVMLVDDEKRILDGLSVMIDWNKYGFDICARTRNGLEALQAAKQWKPDLIVTDIRMPNMDGLELIRLWKSSSPITQFIILSGYSEFSYAKQAMQLGVRHYVLKPIEETGLESCLIEVAQELRASRKEATEINLLRKQAKAYLKLQRENMLRDWIHAGSQDEEIIANLAELEVMFPYPNYCSFALEREDQSPWSELDMEAAASHLIEIIPVPAVVYPFRFTDKTLGLMFSFGGLWEEVDMQEWALKLQQKLLASDDAPIRIEPGSRANHMQELNESFDFAHNSLGNKTNQEAVELTPQPPQYRRSIVDEIKDFIDLHYEQELTLSNIADRFFIHAHYLSQLFKKKTGVTFLHYLTATRMEHAKRHLMDTDLKVYEISRLVGYEDSKYFSKIFERIVGMKPSEFKQTFMKS
jgi:two-component system response regulator YesN